jgi:hypothetical protein
MKVVRSFLGDRRLWHEVALNPGGDVSVMSEEEIFVAQVRRLLLDPEKRDSSCFCFSRARPHDDRSPYEHRSTTVASRQRWLTEYSSRVQVVDLHRAELPHSVREQVSQPERE